MHILLIIFALVTGAPALAEELKRVPPVTDESAKTECGACHLAYQPQLLPAEAWRRLFSDLSNHFGTDASLSDPVGQGILDYYIANAGRYAATQTSSRITETAWWVRAHRGIRAATWAKPEVKFKGNCSACHRGAEQGLYEDED